MDKGNEVTKSNKTLLQKLEDGEWERFSEEEKKEFRSDNAKYVGGIIEFYRNLERRSLEKARQIIIGQYSPA